MFTLGADLAEGEDIIIEFPADTDIDGVVDADATIAATSGIGSSAFTATTINVVAGDIVDETLTLTVPDTGPGGNTVNFIGTGAIVQVVVSGVINPSDPGDYTLDVSTTAEDAVTSVAYTITEPTVPDLPGVVKVYNPSEILMVQTTGADAIQDAIDAAGKGYTIEIGPGTYTENPNTADAEVTFVVSDTVGSAIIVGDWTIDEDDTTIDGLTIDGDINVRAADFILQNSTIDGGGTLVLSGRGGDDATVTDTTFNVEADVGVEVDADGATITGSTFNVEAGGTGVLISSTATVEDSTFTGASGTGIQVDADVAATIEGNTFDGLATALDIDDGAVTVKFNSILDSEDFGVDTDVAVDATFNWWGTTVAADIGDMIEGDADYEPFLTDTADAVLSARDYAVDATSLDASTTVGVRVVSITAAADVILVAKYAANPQEALADAEAFFDVYVGGPDDPADEVSLRFYVGDENSILYAWSRDTDKWVELDAGFSAYGGYMFITVDADLLGRTPFAVVTPPAVAPTLATPVATTPDEGEKGVALTPTFAWEPVAGAAGYHFQLADNPHFVVPLVNLVGDFPAQLIVTAYAYVGELDYSTPYYWRVKAVSGTIAAGDLVESAWASGVFFTMDEPVEPPPPIVIEEVPPPEITVEQPDISIEQPDIIVPLPDVVEKPITPAWIYVIVAVGAVLVIALVVLIVRTRRVA
jgi:hypothetical protein